MVTTVTGRALLIAVESERTAEAFEEAAHRSWGREIRRKYFKTARVLREQAEAIRLSA